MKWKFEISEETCERAISEVKRRFLSPDEPDVSFANCVHGLKVELFFAELIGVAHVFTIHKKRYDFPPKTNVVSRRTSANGKEFRVYDWDVKDKSTNSAIPFCVHTASKDDLEAREFQYIGYFESDDAMKYGTRFSDRSSEGKKLTGWLVGREHLKEEIPPAAFLYIPPVPAVMDGILPEPVAEPVAEFEVEPVLGQVVEGIWPDNIFPPPAEDLFSEMKQEESKKDEIQALQETVASLVHEVRTLQAAASKTKQVKKPIKPEYQLRVLSKVQDITNEQIQEKLKPYFDIVRSRDLTADEWNNISFSEGKRASSLIAYLRHHNTLPKDDLTLLRSLLKDPNLFRIIEFGSRWKSSSKNDEDGWIKLGVLYAYSILHSEARTSHPNLSLVERIEVWQRSSVSKVLHQLEGPFAHGFDWKRDLVELARKSVEMPEEFWEPRDSKKASNNEEAE